MLVTGAGGMLGQAVVSRAAQSGWDVHGATRDELDITDEPATVTALERVAPNVLVNCAGYTDVDGAESDRAGAHAANATGPGVLARATAAGGVRLIHVSTDYVFDGRATRPYVESDPTDPQCVYGATKLEGELEVQAASADHAIVRTAWLFGAGGRNFVDTMLGLADQGRDEVRVVTDQVGCPTWTGHLAAALLAIALHRMTGIVHAAGDGQCTWNELAREVFAVAGRDVRVLPSTTADTARPAPRPAYSVLRSDRHDAPRLPDWREGVRAHLSADRAEATR